MSAAEMREAALFCKPCPFCGGIPEYERVGTARQSMIIVCQDCGARVESSDVAGLMPVESYHWNRRAPLPDEEGMVESRAFLENTWSGIRAGLTYEQNALLRAYGAPTYEERERALNQIARDIAERVAQLEARAAIRAINGGEP